MVTDSFSGVIFLLKYFVHTSSTTTIYIAFSLTQGHWVSRYIHLNAIRHYLNLPFTTKCSPIPTAHLTKCTNLYFFGNGIFGTTMLLLPGTSFFSFTCLIDAGGFLLKAQSQNKDFGQHHSLINSTCSMCDLHQINISAISPASQSKFGWHHQLRIKI